VYNDSNYTVGAVFFEEDNFNLPTADWTGTLYMRITATARANNDSPYSNPRFIVNFSGDICEWRNGHHDAYPNAHHSVLGF
jgi:hypothetical protein